MVTTLEDAPQPVSAPRPLVTLEPGQSQAQTMRILLEAGVHFGHQTKRWNPKMRPYIFTERNGIHIIDLAQTVSGLNSAVEFVTELAAQGGRLMMVGTKKQAQDVIAEEAKRCGQFYVNKRWPGGLLTNFVTTRQRLRDLSDLDARKARGEFEQLPKQEAKKLTEKMNKLIEIFGGIRQMYDLPSAVFVVDPHKERIAMAEALRLEIPVIAICDTNCDPDEVDYVVPGNDDAIRSVKIITNRLADAFIEGVNRREALRADQMMNEQEERAARGDREDRGDRGERRDRGDRGDRRDRGDRGDRGGRDRGDRRGGGRDRGDRGDQAQAQS